MSERSAAADRPLWIGFGVFVLGRVLDLLWHATHPEFETSSDQIQAHTVVWLGALIILVVSARAVAGGSRQTGTLLALLGTVLYAPVAVWHFWEHLHLRDPDLPHILLVVADALIIAALVVTAVQARGRGRRT